MATVSTDLDELVSSSESEFNDENCEDLSSAGLKSLPEYIMRDSHIIEALHLDHNFLAVLPHEIRSFKNLIMLDLSNNSMKEIGEEICALSKLRTLIAKNNEFNFGSLPKDFGVLTNLEVLNLSGNRFSSFPLQLTELPALRCLYMGGNRMSTLPHQVKRMERLEILYLGGNKLVDIPPEVGCLHRLTSLVLCNNQLQGIPDSLGDLVCLRSLSLHNNNISILPHRIVSLNLVELSLRNNPLVTRFVAGMTFNPPSLLELSGRSVLSENIHYTNEDLPRHLIGYLKCANKCVNPKCKGVFFTSRVEHVKFVDFCGKYRVPLLEYLCTPTCTVRRPHMRRESASSDDDDVDVAKMKKVLLG